MKTDLNTLVFRGEFNKDENPLVTPLCGLKSSAWMRGDALTNLDAANELIDKLYESGCLDEEREQLVKQYLEI